MKKALFGVVTAAVRPSRLLRAGCRLTRARRGFAAVEFALLAPIMMVMWCGIVDLSNAVMVSAKTMDMAQDLGDLVSRCSSVSTADITSAFNAATIVLRPYVANSTNSNGYVASVIYDPTTGASSLAWCDGVNTSCPAASTLATQGAGLGDAGTSVLIAGVTYTYQPYFTSLFTSSIVFSKKVFVHPRLVQQVGHVTGTACS